MATQQISKRAESWLNKTKHLDGIWFETVNGYIVLKGILGGVEVDTVLSLAQAKALQTMLNTELAEVSNGKV